MVYTMTSILVNAGSFKLLFPKKKNDQSPRFEPEEECSNSLGPKLTSGCGLHPSMIFWCCLSYFLDETCYSKLGIYTIPCFAFLFQRILKIHIS